MLFIKKFISIFHIGKQYITLVIVFFFINCTDYYSQEDLIGTWNGKYFDQDITITFNENFFDMTIGNAELNDNQNFKGIYLVNFNKKPIPLSLKEISNLNHSLYTIIFFKNNDEIVISEFAPKWRIRNISFDDSKNNFTLQRITKNN